MADVARTLLSFVRTQLWALPALVVLGLVASLAEGIGIGMMIPLLDAILRGEQEMAPVWFVDLIRHYGAGLSQEARLVLLAGTIFGLITLKSVLAYASTALSAWFTHRTIHTLRCALFRQLLEVGEAFFARTDPGRIYNTLRHETWRTGEAVAEISSMLISACAVTVIGVLLLLISWELTLAVIAGVVAVSLLVRLVAGWSRGFGAATVEAGAAVTKRVLETLSAIRVIRLFGQEAREQKRFDRDVDRFRAAALHIDMAVGLIQPLTEFLYVPLFLGTLLLAWHIGISLPTLLAFLVLLYRLQPHVRCIDHLRVRLASLAPAAAEVAALLDRRDKPYIRSGARPFHGLREVIRFDNVSFCYDGAPDRRPAVAGLSFEIRKNELTAIVGGSGAGKSTLISLLCRLYDPHDGDILIDGVPLRELDLPSWHRHIAFAGQDFELMGDTILENITYGCPDADQKAVIAATDQADAHNFIMSLPEGYDSSVGERGLRLSAGQRQRIGLARALLRNPQILILDEATNALDSVSESAIQETLERLAGRVTMVVIAHRLSTIRHADRVIVLSEGHVLEQGRPHELLNTGGMFAQFSQLQVVAFEGAEPRATVAGGRGVP